MPAFLVFCLWLATAAAQSVTPSNKTYPDATIDLALASSEYMRLIPVVGLTASSMTYAPHFQGPLLLGNASSQLQIAAKNIVLISCDPYSGNIQPANVLDTAEEGNATAVVLYSEDLQSCGLSDAGSYERVYTVADQTSAVAMLAAMADGMWAGTLATRDSFANSGNGTNPDSTSGTSNNSPLGPSPSTAVAMIILYSITGIITALFLIIIITGAVRAHRHPERYGPRNGIGRPRQSRARGLAMAMLESLPIVKFGDRTGQEGDPKTADVEMGSVAGQEERDTNAATAVATEQERSTDTPQEPKETHKTEETSGESSNQIQESGIAAAVERPKSPHTEEDSSQGCSICTEDFQIGEDQRVLPCDHRFHPACVDPWLLNVSGTCPLCRIDLRPTTSRNSAGSPPPAAGDELAPPLDDNRRHARRSLFGPFTRPERMTREERVEALRQYRERQAASSVSSEERGLRERLRGAFRVRTRRTGEEQQEDSGAAISSNSDER